MAQAVTAQAALLVPLAERSGQPELAAQWRTYLNARSAPSANDDLLVMANARNAEGHTAREQGDLDRARASYLAALTAYRDAGISGGTALSESSLGFLASETGDSAGAATHHAAAMAAAVAADEPASLALAIEGIASLAVVDDAERATLLLGAAATLWAEAAPVRSSHREDMAECLRAAVEVLGPVAFDEAMARGQGLERPEAIATALAAASRLPG
jgi:hypothetical protein